jgi:UDP-N-acetyl-2-amino-2-deoxyglucuronate dehydrogenase
MNFALIGAAGYIAPRHMQAIKETGNRLVCALDPHDAVGVLDSYFPNAQFFTQPEKFETELELLKEHAKWKIDYVSICSPNYLHYDHIRMALRNGADAICEKPLVLNDWQLDNLLKLEQETGRRVYTVLQLRYHPEAIRLREMVQNAFPRLPWQVNLVNITSRGLWYYASWKADENKSGGLAFNIGIHFLDLLQWVFGEYHWHEPVRDPVQGRIIVKIAFLYATVHCIISINKDDIPPVPAAMGKRTWRRLTVDNEVFDFSEGFTGLHTKVYSEILAGRGYGIDDARQSIEIAEKLR